MKLVIPMSGQGSRFKAVGYQDVKPLISVDGKSIIAHVLDMFPDEDDVVFICNKEHLADPRVRMREILLKLKPNAQIVSVPGHRKGPVYDTAQAFDVINDDEEVIVSYCDFTQRWDYAKFKADLLSKKPAGAVPSYTGFHPHLLHKNLYAGILADKNGWLTDIQEKHCFTKNPEDSFHSGGIYYFASGTILKKYSHELIKTDLNLNGEFYTSMLYYLLKRDNLPIYVPTATHFMQWGTPTDLEEYEAWSEKIHQDLGREKRPSAIPDSRRKNVTIPHHKDSEAYQKSYRYWLATFSQ